MEMTYHNASVEIIVGDYMRSPKMGYRVLHARLVRGHTDKWRLRVLRCYPEDIPPTAIVHGVRWFPRGKKK